MYYATITANYARQLILRAYESVSVSNISAEEIAIRRDRYLDHDTFSFERDGDFCKVRCYYSGRITISGTLKGYVVNEKLF